MGKKKEEKEVNRKKTDKDGFWFTQDKSKTFLLEIIIFFPQTGKIWYIYKMWKYLKVWSISLMLYDWEKKYPIKWRG